MLPAYRLWMQNHPRYIPVMLRLHELILQAHPRATLVWRYNGPFYDVLRWLCYLKPEKDGSLSIGFCYGHLMSNAAGNLRGEGSLKQVRYYTIPNPEAFDEEAFLYLLHEAILINEAAKK